MIERLEAASELLADACVDVIVFHCTAVRPYAPDLAHGIRERLSEPRESGASRRERHLAALSKLNANVFRC